MRKTFSLLLVVFLYANLCAEVTVLKGRAAEEKIPNSEIVRFKDFTSIPNYVKFKSGKELPLGKLESWLSQFYSSDEKLGLTLLKKEGDKLGFTHYRYQQTINGVPVDFGIYIAHVKNGLVHSVNGELFTGITSSTAISISETTALSKAVNYIGAITYKWQIPAEENHLKEEQKDENATYYPKGELVFINNHGNINEDLILAYKFNIYAQNPLSRKEVYVNAQNGQIVWEQNKIHEVDVTGTANTGYSGAQTIISDDLGNGSFRLQETGRGNGIRTYNSQNNQSYGTIDFTNNSFNWLTFSPAVDAYATDAHWGAEMTYDYYLNTHSRNSIDGNGFALLSYVHYDNNFSNAFWDGQRMTYGDGSGNNSPFTALDIAGHEITHGLTSNTANLTYQAESGALNESFSDIFGVSVEYTARPAMANWKLGEDLGFIIRDMANPNSKGDPDTYFGNNWASLTGGDNGGVHTNSGVQNFWYVLLTDGGSGTNDNGDSYTVNGLGLTDASRVAFRNLTVYLTPSSQYVDARFYAIQSAVDLFGGCTSQVESVTNAWYAVGVGNAYSPVTVSDFTAPYLTSCQAPFTVNFNNTSINGITFNWNFGDGNTSTQNNPSNTYNNYGTYTVELIANGGATCGIDTTTKVAYIVVDSTQPCITILPTSGTVATKTTCTGTIYDSGGSLGNYGANEDAQITISPVGASTVDISFVSFDVEPGSSAGLCDYDYVEVFDGPNTASPLIDRYCNNNIPTLVSSTGGSITIVFHSDPGVENAGFQVDWSCNISSVAPTANFTADVDTTCTGVVNFSDLSTNGPTSWTWDFGDGNNSSVQNPTNTYLANGLYTVQLTAANTIGNDLAVKTNYIYVNMPNSPVVNGDAVCENSTANLSANGVGTIEWYSNVSGGTPITTGSNYTTPILTSTTTYYVQDVVPNPIQTMGKVDNTGGGGNYTTNQFLYFDVYKSMIIDSVDVYSGANGIRTIQLRTATGTVLQTKIISIPTGTQTIYLGFSVSPGTDYQLGISSSSAVDMYRNNANVNYPYTLNGVGSVTHSSATQNSGLDHYYFFYNWKVREADCVSPRVPVTATVNICTGVNQQVNNQLTIYPNPASEKLIIEGLLSDENITNKSIKIVNVIGETIFNAKINSNKQTLDISALSKGLYFIVLNEGNLTYKLIKH